MCALTRMLVPVVVALVVMHVAPLGAAEAAFPPGAGGVWKPVSGSWNVPILQVCSVHGAPSLSALDLPSYLVHLRCVLALCYTRICVLHVLCSGCAPAVQHSTRDNVLITAPGP